MIKIAIVDDHQMFIDGIKSLLRKEKEIEIMWEANDGFSAIEQLKKLPVDLILLDISMPGLDGIETAKIIHEKHSAKVMMLTMHDEIDKITIALEVGVAGYILKNTNREELSEGIHNIKNGSTHYSKAVADKIVESMRGGPGKAPKQEAVLTKREKEVLQLIVQEYTSPEIAEKLFISINTAETHRKNLLAKIGARNTAGLVRYALESGIIE